MDSEFNGPPRGGPPPDGFGNKDLQLRIITIVLTGINIFAAAAMAIRILWDTRTACMKRRRSLRRGDLAVLEDIGGIRKELGYGARSDVLSETGQSVGPSEFSEGSIGGGIQGKKSWWEMIPAAEVFPLVLAVTIFVQGTMLAIVEAEGLNMGLFRGNCRYLSEIAWVALWITPYIVLSFTIETAIRALSQPRFQPRSGRAIIYCIFFASVLTVLTWVPSRTMPEEPGQDFCDGQLMSFVDQFAAGGLGIMVALLPIAIFMGGVVMMHLSKDVAIDKVEKTASSRTVYFMLINVLQWIFMVPNYALTAQNHPENSTAVLATIVANVAGILVGGLYIYLRTRAVPEEDNDETITATTIVHLGTGRQVAREKEPSIITKKPHSKRDDESVSSRPALASILSEYYDVHTISDIPRSPTASEGSELETTSILRSPRSPRSPTSIYSRDNRASHAPSLFSQYTTHSFKRLGDEISHMISGLRSTDSPTLPRSLPVSPSPRKQATNYTIFPPSADRPRTSGTSKTPTSKLQVSSHARTPSRPPTRPSRAAVPTINMGRRQPSITQSRVQSHRSDSTTQTLQIPKPVSRINSVNKSPARPFEVAIPPRPDNGDAESFREILIWKENEAVQNRV